MASRSKQRQGGGSYAGRFAFLKDWGLLALRLAFGWSLIQWSFSEVFDAEAMRGFSEFLKGMGIPAPLAAAYLCKGTELAGGVSLMAGVFVRLVSVPLVVNFLVVVFLAQWGKPWDDQRAGVQMLAVSLFFLANGAGGLSADRILRHKGD